MIWFTSDEHFNHGNILKLFVYRPFSTVERMNAEIIKRHNERVKPGHTVIHLGDFRVTNCGPNSHELMEMLNGNHVFLCGNHDKNNGCNSPLKYMVIEQYNRLVVCAHRPEDAQKIMEKLSIDLAFVGHVHEKWKFLRSEHGDMVNVGVDQWDFYPIDTKQIFKAYKKWRNGE